MKKTLVVLLAGSILAAAFPASAQTHRTQRAGSTASRSLETTITSISARTDGNGVLIKWRAAIESNTAGYLVYRVDGGEEKVVSPEVIPAASLNASADPAFDQAYSFFDPKGGLASVYSIRYIRKNGTEDRTATVATAFDGELRNSADAALIPADNDGPLTAQRNRGELRSDTQILPEEVRRIVEENSIEPDPVKNRWVIQQPGVKIGVRSQGIYRISREQLMAAGFNVDTKSQNWQLYTDGIEQAMTVAGGGSFIEFYGSGIDTIESDTRTYFLINAPTAGKRIATRPAGPNPETVTAASYDYSTLRKERTIYVDDIMNGPPENYFGRILTSGTASPYTFQLTGVDQTQSSVQVTVTIQGYSLTEHTIEVVLNGQTLAPMTGSGRNSFSKTYSLPPSAFVEGTNSLSMRAVGPGGDLCLFDSVGVSMKRNYKAEQNRAAFYTTSIRATKVGNFQSSNVRLYDVSYQGSPIRITDLDVRSEGSTFTIAMPAGRAGVFFATGEDQMQEPAWIRSYDTQSISGSAAGADLVIISHRSFLGRSETWANYRRGQGAIVKVVDVDKIYDEYNYGVLAAEAVKAYLSDIYVNWANAPRYVLLMGDATYDPRNYQGAGDFNFVPTKLVTTVYTETGSDEYLADLDGDGLAEIAIGRIPARTDSEIDVAYNKTLLFESLLGTDPLSRGFTFAFDEPNGYDFEGMSGRMRDQLPSGTSSTMIYRHSENAQTNLIDSINSGKYLVNYSGHGSTGLWASTSFFSNTNVPSLTNAARPSIFTMLTCLNGYFIPVPAVSASLGERLLFLPTGGAAASWASTGKTTPDVQEVMGLRFFQQLGADQYVHFGDYIKDSKTVIGGGVDVRLSWVLLGDPMLRISLGNGAGQDLSPVRKNASISDAATDARRSK